MENRGFNSLYFILFVLLAMLVTSTFAPNHVQNAAQKAFFTTGLVVLIAGSVWRIVQKIKRVSQKKSLTVQILGTLIAVLASLSELVW
ncbi:MAG: hypothetical protein A2919_01115 [Candidatus Spechtbacteria bacterium RIFCSPLOWO2_01_FULL_43_12]|uniref:Uncharacterized protein n=1 Tax=Candidatus Spechtbacteria bacterium RIFCSPLOWO2_01_FULL_43_12 TaxID=1802162 RepID=A0A1G2HEB7_9BACT|nr:MAG: hypothetical protein A2919_01115 [Candidatus Spechtbacteria bacterium RIFCSPLOWO2_01_FULL_43_12]